MLIEGTVAFSNLTTPEMYQGQSTGKYSIVLQLEDITELRNQGVKVKEYEGKPQRKFTSKFELRPEQVVDTEGNPVHGEIPRGSKVRLQYSLGKQPHPVHGVSPYLNAIRVLEVAQRTDDGF